MTDDELIAEVERLAAICFTEQSRDTIRTLAYRLREVLAENERLKDSKRSKERLADEIYIRSIIGVT